MLIGLWPVQKWEGGTRVQSAEDGVRGKVGAWHDRLQSADYRLRRKGRSVASPRPCFHRRTRRSLAPTRERSSLEAARLARSANPTRYKVKRGTGNRDVGRRTDATQSRPYQRQSKKGNRDVGAFSSTVIGNLNSVIFFSSTQHPQLNLSSTSPIGRRL